MAIDKHNIKNKFRSEDNLPEEFSWENMEKGIYDKMNTKKSRRPMGIIIFSAIALSFIIIAGAILYLNSGVKYSKEFKSVVDDSINVFIDKFGGTSPVLVATKKGIQPGTTSIIFDMVGPDIKELFYNDYLEISIKFGAKAGHEMKKNTTFITSLQFKVIAYKP